MKKVLMMLMFSALFFVTGAFAAENTLAMLDKNQVIAQNDTAPAAEEAPAATDESVFPNFVCVDSVTFSLLPDDIDNAIEAGGEYSTFLTDTKAESIDKKIKS